MPSSNIPDYYFFTVSTAKNSTALGGKSISEEVTKLAAKPSIDRIAAAVLYTIMFMLGVVGNTLVLVAVSVSKKLQTIANTFIVTLAVIDLITCLQIPVQMLAFINHSEGAVFSLVCSITGVFSYISGGANAILLVFIAFHRYVIVSMSLLRRRQVFSRATIPVMILFSVGFPFSLTVGFAVGDDDSNIGLCADVMCTIISPILETISGLYFIICFGSMVTFYGLLLWHVRNHSRKVAILFANPRHVAPSAAWPPNPSDSSSGPRGMAQAQPLAWRRIGKREMQITKSMVTVVVAFVFFMSPIITSTLVPDNVTEIFHGYALLSMHITSVINPILYAWKYPDFKKTFKLILTWKLEQLSMPATWLRELTGN